MPHGVRAGAPARAPYPRRHHGRHVEALSRHLGTWHDAHDRDWWSRPSWLYWAGVAAGGRVTP